MPEIMKFGRMKDLSVEQIALKDYKYFDYIIKNIPIKKYSLRERFEYVDNVVNNFISVKNCVRCDNPAEYVSVYHNYDVDYRGSSGGFIYCSSSCYNSDPKITDCEWKTSLEPLSFRTAISNTKFDTNRLVELMSDCMGLKKGRKTKEYLEDFFDDVKLR